MNELELENRIFEIILEVTEYPIDDMTTSDLHGAVDIKARECMALFKEYQKYNQ